MSEFHPSTKDADDATTTTETVKTMSEPTEEMLPPTKAGANQKSQEPQHPALQHRQEQEQRECQYSTKNQQVPSLPPIKSVSTCEEMNPSRRCSFEDCSVYAPAGSWDVPDPNMAFLCICDGHGGRDMVEYLEDGLLYHVSQELQVHNDGENDDVDHRQETSYYKEINILKRLEQAFLMADIHSSTLGVTTSGATCAVCLVTRSKPTDLIRTESSPGKGMQNDPEEINQDIWTIYTANAGDARIVLGHEGRAYRMTKDHRTDDPDEVRRIEQSGGFMFKGRVLGVLAVTRSLGDHCMKEYVIAQPYTQEKAIAKSPADDTSFIILACDGLWDVISDQDAVDFVLDKIDEKDKVAQYLVKEALDRGSTDNITVSVAWL